MHKELILFLEDRPVPVVIRNYDRQDFGQMIEIQKLSFPPPFPASLWWTEEQLEQHVALFPEGALCAEVDGVLIGSMTALLVQAADHEQISSHSWGTITDQGYIRNHDPGGDTLYVVDICVIPEYRRTGIGKWLMQSMYEVVVHLGLNRLLGGGRMPGYHRYVEEASAQKYLDQVVTGVWKDPVITFLLRCGRMPVGVVKNYIDDEDSCDYAALMEWRNPFIQHKPQGV